MSNKAIQNNAGANALYISHSKVEINGLTFGQALNKLEQYLWRDEYYLPFHRLPEVLERKGYNSDPEAVQEYISEISADAFFDILGTEVDYPSNYALGGTANDSIWSVTAEAYKVVFRRAQEELEDLQEKSDFEIADYNTKTKKATLNIPLSYLVSQINGASQVAQD